MRVVLINHGAAAEWGGGDSVQIQETARVLKQRGHKVKIVNSDTPDLGDADIAHIFNCRVPNSFIQQINTCKKANIPVVVSPIWISIGRALWGSRGTYGILCNSARNNNKGMEKELEMLKNRQLIVQLDGGTLDADGKGSFDLSWQNDIGRLLNQAEGILPNSWLELKATQTDLMFKKNNYEIAHYGVNPQIFLDANPNKFREHTGIKGDFILQAGRIEPGKNQAMLCYAMRKSNIPIVLIGGSSHWPSYGELCKDIYGKNLTIINHLPQKLLASAYAAARVHSLTSWMDTCGLVSLEAAMSNTPIIGSTFGHELEYLKNDAWLADPGDPENIREQVVEAWETNRKSKKAYNLKTRIMSEYNWEKTVTNTELLYSRIIENASHPLTVL